MKSCTLKLKSYWVKAALALVLTGAVGAASAIPADPQVYDLTAGSPTPTNINGALFFTPPVPAINSGTGFWDPFVRIQTSANNADSATAGCGNGASQYCEQGYNTSDRDVQFDEKGDQNFTRDLKLGEVPIVLYNGISYFEFLLDIAEPAADNTNQTKSLLSLDQLQLFVGTNQDTASAAGKYQGNFGNGTLGNTTLAWTLDSTAASPTSGFKDNSILLDYNLVGSGNGRADMVALIPTSAVPAGLLDGGKSVYLFSRFGDQTAPDPSSSIAEGSFEEWALRKTPSGGGGGGGGGGVPEPGTFALFGAAILAGVFNSRRRRQACA